jgi:hypothetical protein
MDKNAEKSRQLGMSVGTASNRLRKMLLYMLAVKAGMATCIRCGKLIASVNDFTIDHVKPWLHEPNAIELFFDLNNVGFSHMRCNLKSRRQCLVVRSSKSFFKGVELDPRGNRKRPWRAVIYINNGRKNFGYHATPQEAAAVFDEESVRIFGKMAVTNKSLGLL